LIGVDPLAWYGEHLRIINCPAPLRTLPSLTQPLNPVEPFDDESIELHALLAELRNLEARQLRLRDIVKDIIGHKMSTLEEDRLKVNLELVIHSTYD
jgi:hypothetical protein